MIQLIPGGFRLFNPSGPGICPDGPSTCPVDVLITITDLAPEDSGTSFTVAAVNTTQRVPEPATIALVSTGLAAVIRSQTGDHDGRADASFVCSC